MSSNSKSQKLYKELNARQRKNFEDRLTDLPNSLRTKILSCLSTKDAVKTSILSKEWKWSWTFVTNLDFDDNLFRRAYNHDHFVSFVYRVLLLRDRSSLQTFRMKCSNRYCKRSLINASVAAALLCTVKELNLSVLVKDRRRLPCLLPCGIFLCKTLVVLKLDTRGYVIKPASTSLPSLKTLHISNVKFSNDMSFVSLFSGCHVLEELRLSRCIGKDIRVINITVPSLTSLTIEDLPYDFVMPYLDQNYQVVIDAPSLKYLNFREHGAHGYVLKNLHHLVKAEISLGFPLKSDFLGVFKELRSKPITDLFIWISQVQSLVLSRELMEAIGFCEVELPTFSNLTYLELAADAPKKLLENSPCLETLHFRMGSPIMIFPTPLPIDDVPPPCFLSHLKVIKIDKFEGLKYDKPTIEYFLKNAKILEELIISYSSYGLNDVDTEADAKQLLMLPRSSSICKIRIL